jgi:hypothetical protein
MRVWLDLMLQSEYNFCLSLSRPLLLQSEYNFCLSPSRPLLPQSEYTFCLTPSKPSACVQGDHSCVRGDHTSERERERGSVCVVRCSLEASWSCYSILKFPWNKNYQKKVAAKKKEKSKNNQKKQQQRRGFVCVFLSFVWWCFVITFVSRLMSLAQSILGPAYYHRWTISQLAFFANVVLVLSCLLLSATYSSTYIPTAASQGFSCQHRYTLF